MSRPTRRNRRLLAALVSLALPLGAVQPTPALAHPDRSGTRSLRPLPVQRTGSAAGLGHLVGKSDNHVTPQTLRGRYPTVPVPAGSTPHDTSRLALATAAVPPGYRAGLSVEQPGRRARYSRTYTNADGTETTVLSAVPVNYQAADGSWQPVRPQLSTTVGALVATGGAEPLRLAGRLGAATTATVGFDDAHQLSWTAVGARPVSAQVSGATARYPGFLPGADMELTSLAGGVKESVVLHGADSPAVVSFRLRLTGLTARLDGSQVDLVDAAGAIRAVIPAGSMTDAAGASSAGVRYQLTGDTLRVRVDRAWLRDPHRVFPVRVDPTVLGTAASSALTVQDGAAYTGGQDFQAGIRNGVRSAAYLAFPGISSQLANETIYSAKLSVVNYNAGSCAPRSAGVYPVTQAWSTTDTSLRYPGPSVGGVLAAKSYAHGYVGLGQSGTSCPVSDTLYDLGAVGRDLVQGWVTGSPNYGLSVRASGTDPAGWKQFTGTATANPPQLYVTHSPYNAGYLIPKPVLNPPVLQNQNGQLSIVVTNKGAQTWTPSTFYLAYRVTDSTGRVVAQQKAADLPGNVARNARVTLTATVNAMPAGKYTLDFTMVHVGGPVFTDDWVPPARLLLQVFNVPPVPQTIYPPNGYQAPSLAPQLWATAIDKDAPSSSLTYNFSICPASGACWTSGYQGSSAWTVPAGDLVWNQTYTWHADVKDSNGAVTATPTSTLLTPVPQPDVTGHLGSAPYASKNLDFDPLTGNYTTGAVDATIATAGPALNVARTYNSLDPRTDEAFGAGWSSVYDMKLGTEPDGSGNVLVTLSDGQQVRFGKNPDGSYAGPADRSAQLVYASGSWTLRDHAGNTFNFSGTGKLTQLQGPWGLPVVLTYDLAGKLAKATSRESSRYLTFTWTGNHVSSVATNPVNGVSPTWTYSYTGDLLSSVCAPPGSTCTSYAASTGSHYRSAVLDSNPDSYWRLGEPAGSPAAASQLATNLGADAASVTGVTLGGAGALAGTGDTSASFDGVASYVGLPDGIAKRSRDMAVELWFKTTAIQANPLFGYQDTAWTGTPGTGVPVLYLGTDGKLRGQLAASVHTPITSAAAVNDGKWHHVVLSATGGVQTLYLDGVSVGTLTAAVSQATLTYAQVGAAYATSSWPGWSSTPRGYFKGSIDEVAVYSHPLGADAVATHRRLGTQAASQLSQLTLPSGRIAAAVSYDTAFDRIHEYTDANGGTWQLGTPQTSGGDSDLRLTVDARDPAGRPYRYEYDALGGWLLRAGLPAGVSVRPEDQPGPPTVPSPPTGPSCTTAAPGDPTFCVWDTSGAPTTTVFDAQGMAVRSYQYDVDGELTTAIDENGDTVSMSYDALGNVTARTTCRSSANDCDTTRYSYPTGLTDPLDPRWYQPTEVRDPRSGSATDNTYRTTFSYTTKGDPAGQSNADGSSTHEYYTNGSEAAVGGGTVPSGLLSTSIDRLGSTTSYGYYSTGDLAQITQPSGLVIKYGYDALGRQTSETEVSDSFPAGVTTNYDYDADSRLVSTSYPATTDPVTGARHQRQTTVTYDPDGHPLTSTESDLLGGDAARQTSLGYDDHGLLESVTDPAGGQIGYEHDRFGNVTAKTDQDGNRWEYAYTARNAIAEVRLRDVDSTGDSGYTVLSSVAYDYAGRPVQQTDAAGRTTVTDYYHDGLVKSRTLQKFHDPDGTTRDLVLEQNSYDAAGNLIKQVTSNGTRTTAYQRDVMGRVTSSTEDPSGVARTTSYSYDLAGDVLQRTVTGNSSNLLWPAVVPISTVSYRYDAAGRPISRQTTLSTGSTATTTTSYDQRGFAVAVTDPRGNLTGADPSAYTTNYGYDEQGQPTSVTSTPVSAEQNQQPAATVRPRTLTGYDTYGEPTSVQDPLGNTSGTSYDALGRPVRGTAPAYTPPGGGTPITPVRTVSYDPLGNLTGSIDPAGNTTRYSYDRLRQLISVDAPSNTDADRAVTRYGYAHTGDLLSSTDPTGAVTRYTYDDLDRPVTITQVERTPQPANLTSTISYDDASDLTGLTTPTGASTTESYDTDGQLTASTDPNGVVTSYGYDSLGNRTRSSDGLGRTSKLAFDLAGRLVSASDLDPMLNPIRSVSLGYDVAGNPTSVTDPVGAKTTTSYDALNRMTGNVQQVSASGTISTSYGYDAAGNRTRYTDGSGNARYYTVNSWGLPESTIEPATTAQPAAADRTWTTSYNPMGQPVTVGEPGGVQVRSSYDAAGRLTSQVGTGAESPDASRSLGYDAAGRITSVNAPGGTDSYGYDDRGLLVSASGPSGPASFGYDDDGNLVQRTDAAGTGSFSYLHGRLASQTDPVTGQSQTLSYDGAGAVSKIGYGGLSRGFSYDSLGRVTGDTVTNSGGSQLMSTSYGYDLAGRVTSLTTTGVAGAGTSSYGYDLAGRMTSWTSGGSTTSYAWDADGNRVQAGSRAATFDQRDRLLTDGSTSFSYAPRGTLASQTGPSGTERYTFDGFDRMVGDGVQAYGYDGFDRLASQNGTVLKYAGTSPQVVADQSQSFGRGPDGSLLSVGQGSTHRAVLADQHGDVTAGFDPTNGSQTSVPDSKSYDPWGNVTASAGTAYHVGYQGALTDPSTGKVDLNARWYDPASGRFTTRDSADNTGGPSAVANEYSYAAGDPMSLVDPSGHNLCTPDPGSSGSGPTPLDPRMVSSRTGVGCNPGSSGWTDPENDYGSLFGGGSGSGSGGGSGYGSGSGGSGYGSGSGTSGSGSGGSGYGGPSPAEQRYRQLLAAQQHARAAIAWRAKTVQLPAPAAALRPSSQGGVVTSSPSQPANVVSQTSDAVRDNRAATQRIYQQATQQAGQIQQQASPPIANPSACGAPSGGSSNEMLPNYHPDPNNPGNNATAIDLGPCGGSSGPGVGNQPNGNSNGSKPLPDWAKGLPTGFAPLVKQQDGSVGCLLAGVFCQDSGLSTTAQWLTTGFEGFEAIGVAGAICVLACAELFAGGSAVAEGAVAEEGAGLLPRIWSGFSKIPSMLGAWSATFSEFLANSSYLGSVIRGAIWLYNHGGPVLQRGRDIFDYLRIWLRD